MSAQTATCAAPSCNVPITMTRDHMCQACRVYFCEADLYMVESGAQLCERCAARAVAGK